MNLPAALYAIRWLIRDTFRQSLASGIFWLTLGFSLIVILVCLSIGVAGGAPLHPPGEEPPEFLPRGDPQEKQAGESGVTVLSGELTVAFGAFHVSLARDAPDAVHFIQLLLAGLVADTAGILLGLIFTATFLPAFLEPSVAIVLLAKPVPRWSLVAGKYLGVLAFVAFQATIFVVGTWLALGLRTGYWDATYLWAIPLLIFHFAIFYSFSVLLAVCTRSSSACVVGSLLFWFLCWGMNFARHSVVAMPEIDPAMQPLPAPLRWTVEAGYWLLPKPLDMSELLRQALQSKGYFGTVAAFEKVQEMGAFYPEWSLVTSVAFIAVMLVLAARQLAVTDY